MLFQLLISALWRPRPTLSFFHFFLLTLRRIFFCFLENFAPAYSPDVLHPTRVPYKCIKAADGGVDSSCNIAPDFKENFNLPYGGMAALIYLMNHHFSLGGKAQSLDQLGSVSVTSASS